VVISAVAVEDGSGLRPYSIYMNVSVAEDTTNPDVGSWTVTGRRSVRRYRDYEVAPALQGYNSGKKLDCWVATAPVEGTNHPTVLFEEPKVYGDEQAAVVWFVGGVLLVLVVFFILYECTDLFQLSLEEDATESDEELIDNFFNAH